VGKTWAIFFAVNMIAMAALCFAAPAMGLWMPDGVSTHSASVDFLFYVILWITTFFFFLTEAVLIVFLWKYGCGCKEVATGVPTFLKPIGGLIDTPHKIEMAWTIVPAAILLYIAFAQVGTWANVKYQSRMKQLIGEDKTPVVIEVSARQFEWRMRYPSAERMREWLKNPTDKQVKDEIDGFSRNPHADDVHVVNELHVWNHNPVLVHLSTRDVLHSFNLPQFRVKQDAVPGRVIPVWFTPTKDNTAKVTSGSRQMWLDGMGRDENDKPVPDKSVIWDIACAELCGWGHWRMIGRVYVHSTQEDFLEWLEQAGKSEHSRTAVK
jgi:cytochrome c oxidase subunit 2